MYVLLSCWYSIDHCDIYAGLMGMFEKRRYRNLLIYVNEYDGENPATWKKFKPKESTSQQLYDHFGVDKNTIDFTGHAVALHRDEE